MNANNDDGMGSVTLCIQSLKAGDQKAAGTIWGRFSASLVRFSRKRLGSAPRTVNDEEDVALSAFHCLWRGATAGRFPQLARRNDLWRLLAAIAGQKAVDQLRHERRRKRGGGGNHPAVDLRGQDALALAVDREPAPDTAVLLDEDCRRRLDRLRDDELRRIAIWKLEGESNFEIANRLGCGLRSVERKLGVIRKIWLAD
jgi:DNA-directed RNA polymerase specialized sigma24 family protein